MNDRLTNDQGIPNSGWLVFVLRTVRRRPFLMAAGLALLALATLHGILLHRLGGLLTAEQPVDGFDRVWVRTEGFGCDGDGALNKAANLCRQDTARGVLIVELGPTPCVRAGVLSPPSEAVCRELQRRGIPTSRIEILPGPASDPAGEADIVGAWLRRHGQSKVLLLCNRMQGARMRCILDQALEPSLSARVGILGLAAQGVDESNWWKSRSGVKVFLIAALDRIYLALCGADSTSYPPWDYEGFEANMAAIAKERP